MKRHQKVPRLSRRALEKMVADLVQRLDTHEIELAAIRHTHAPDSKQIVGEYYARTSFGIALEHQALQLRQVLLFAKIIHQAMQR